MDIYFEIDRSSPMPLYAQLAEAIKNAIHNGVFAYGHKIPSENELTARCGLSRMTVRSALAQLVSEKYIEKRQGTGAFVSYNRDVHEISGSIDVLLDVTNVYFSPHYIKSISKVLTQRNYQFVIHDTLNSQQEICAILGRILQKGSAGVILQPSCLEGSLLPQLRELLTRLDMGGIPYVVMDRAYEEISGLQMSFDDYAGGRVAAEYLVSLGHERCLMVCNSNYYENRPRMEGFNSVLAEHGLPPLFAVEADGDLKTELPRLIWEQGITAVFNYNDETALAAMRALRNADISIPAQVSVMGFDDTVITTATNPQLTSVVHPKDILGQMVAEKLISLVEKNPIVLDLDVLKPRLHIRASCAPVPQRI